MQLITMLDVTFRSGATEEGLSALVTALVDTRAFAGCQGLEVLLDRSDPSKVRVLERWESLEHDLAYRDWRATEPNVLEPFLAAEPGVTYFHAHESDALEGDEDL